ncbi:MAG: toprim domain-containing protein [Candidatus Bathyarchaeia archaeon]
MSARLKAKEEKILKILEQLNEESTAGKLIIVEGEKDIKTLRTLGIEGKIIMAKAGGKSLLDVVSEIEEMGTCQVILLLDFDRRGRELMKKLKQQLEKTGINPNLLFWRELSALLSREVKDIEGLSTYMENLKRKIYNS